MQLNYFYLLEWEKSVVDIREHYPLLDLDNVIGEELELHRSKFIDRETKVPYILSTTFLVSVKMADEQIKFIARSLKNSSELDKKITLSGLEIEKQYWKSKRIDWGIVTNKEINKIKVRNIKWIHQLSSQEVNSFYSERTKEMCKGLIERILNNPNSIKKIIKQYEYDYSLNKGYGIYLFKILLAQKILLIDMDKPINLNDLGSTLTLS